MIEQYQTKPSSSTVMRSIPTTSKKTKHQKKGQDSGKNKKTHSKKDGDVGLMMKRGDVSDCPIFLRKTYHMIDSCNPAIASWSDDGETFVVKNTDIFAEDVIPQFFKHKNFSSFVRQLNFYGFRKIKTDMIKLSAANEIESKYWKFRHENFRQGRPDLLHSIRKANQQPPQQQQSNCAQEEVMALKREVCDLKDRISRMTGDVEKLTSLVDVLMLSQKDETTKKKKKRKLDLDSYITLPPLSGDRVCAPEGPLPSGMLQPPDHLLEEVHPPPPPPPPQPNGRVESVTSVTSMDLEFVDLFSGVGEELSILEKGADAPSPPSPPEKFMMEPKVSSDSAVPDRVSSSSSPPSSSPSPPKTTTKLLKEENSPATPKTKTTKPSTDENTQQQQQQQQNPNPKLLKQLHNSLCILPHPMQELFVERLVATITDPDCFKNHVEAVSTLAVVAAEQSQIGSKDCDLLALPLAAATLGAFLVQYAGGGQRPSVVPLEG